MNVKSRAQLIVWCLPHMGFVEKEAPAAIGAAAATPTIIGGAAQANTIPVGNTTVGGINGGFNRGSGNNDLGI